MKHPSSLEFVVSFVLIISVIVSEGRNITPLDYNEGKNQTGRIYTISNLNSTGRATNCSEKECFESYGLMDDFEHKTEVAGAVHQAQQTILTGASALFNVWNVIVMPSDSSGARIHMRITNKAIEFGWTVFPLLYPDGLARLFIYMEDGRGNRCFNERCTSFHSTSNRYNFSEPFPHVSTFNGQQIRVRLSIYKDPMRDKWWTSVNDERIGYWSINAFHKFYAARFVRWEGFVTYPTRLGEPHTDTGMGTGGYPNSGYGRTAFIEDMLIKYSGGEFQPPTEPLGIHATTPGCYDVLTVPSLANEGPSILYGGPGGPFCDTHNGIRD